MPKITKNFNPNFSSAGNAEIVKLAKKGDSITFRPADYPMYYGQHWLEDERKFVQCDRVNSPDLENPDPCQYCDKYNKDKETNARLKAKVTFVFPVLDKQTHLTVFYETSQMVWTEMCNQEKKGIKIFDYDWIVERTENKPKYYEITRLEKDPLSEVDQAAYDEAKELDVEAFVKFRMGKKKGDNSGKVEEAESLDDIVIPGDEDLADNVPSDLPF